jgi:glycosyltransferase involved in cell wall biosynthesis
LKKKVLFILSGNLSTTPRAVKAILLAQEDSSCEIVLVSRSEKWKKKDLDLIAKHQLKVNILNLGRTPFLPWFKATILEKFSVFIFPIIRNNIHINANASNKSSIILWRYLKGIDFSNFDLIIGHGGGALYPSWRLSQKYGIPFIFDVEDYHPGESIKVDAIHEKSRRELLMKSLLPEAVAITSASKLIGKYTLDLIGGHPLHQVVLNSFLQSEFQVPLNSTGQFFKPLKIVWYSQKIGFGRGLEIFLESLILIGQQGNGADFELTLIGEIDSVFEKLVLSEKIKSFSELGIDLFCVSALSQTDLHSKLSEFDIGLALEIGNYDLNRQLCITNKIISYTQSGLFILATDTMAQKQFLFDNPNSGIITGQSPLEMAETLNLIIVNLKSVLTQKEQRYHASKYLSWESESEKLKQLFEKII